MNGTSTSARGHVSAVARGLSDRFAQLLRSADRLDALDGRSGALTSEELRGDVVARSAVAREMVARLLRVAVDPQLGPLARALVRDGAQTTSALAARQAVPRFALARRVDDLVDAGLAERDLGPDTVAPTALAAALVDLLDDLEARAAHEMARWLGGST